MKATLSCSIFLCTLILIVIGCQKTPPDSITLQKNSVRSSPPTGCEMGYTAYDANPATGGDEIPDIVWTPTNDPGYCFLVQSWSDISISNLTGAVGEVTWTSSLPIGCYAIGVNSYATNNDDQEPLCGTTFSLTVRGIETDAGTGIAGYSGDGGLAGSAKLNEPTSVAFDNSGNMYISDWGNNVVRKVSASTGDISTFAGNGTAGFSGDGSAATGAELNGPNSVATDASGNVYIADAGNSRIRKVTVSTGYISTVAGDGSSADNGDGSAATSAAIGTPATVVLDGSSNIYLVDNTNKVIRKVTVSTGDISTISTTGYTPQDVLALDASNNIYFSNASTYIYKRLASNGTISIVAGNGTAGYTGDGGSATSAEINAPVGVVFDSEGNMYISDIVDDVIRKVNTSGNISTIAGNGSVGSSGDGGLATSAEFYLPEGLAINPTGCSGNLYVADAGNAKVRMVIQ
jgi:sugar lactone lactonase YvrE